MQFAFSYRGGWLERDWQNRWCPEGGLKSYTVFMEKQKCFSAFLKPWCTELLWVASSPINRVCACSSNLSCGKSVSCHFKRKLFDFGAHCLVFQFGDIQQHFAEGKGALLPWAACLKARSGFQHFSTACDSLESIVEASLLPWLFGTGSKDRHTQPQHLELTGAGESSALFSSSLLAVSMLLY